MQVIVAPRQYNSGYHTELFVLNRPVYRVTYRTIILLTGDVIPMHRGTLDHQHECICSGTAFIYYNRDLKIEVYTADRKRQTSNR